MSLVIPITSGTNFIVQAGPLGPYVPVRYFLPFYDHRIDPFVHSDSIVLVLSGADPISATSVIGEALYNVSALNAAIPGSYVYSVTNKEFLASGSDALSVSGTGSDKIVSASSFDSASLINLLNGRPLSNCISGTSVTYRGDTSWFVSGYVSAAGSNANPYADPSDRNRFFRVQSYGPITSAAGGNARGVFKMRLPHGVGNFKFNKIALYAAKFLANGTEDLSVAPVLFAVAVLKNPILKTTDSTNLNNFELDLELSFYAQGVASQISYLSNDYWNRFQGGLWTDAPGGVAITSLSAVPGSWQPAGRLSITVGDSEKRVIDDVDVKTPHISLANNNNHMDISYDHTEVDTDKLMLKSNYVATGLTIATSGYDYRGDENMAYSYIDLYSREEHGDGNVTGLGFNSYSLTSGGHFSSIESTFTGYVEEMKIQSNGWAVYKTKVSDDGSYVSMVLGKDADVAYDSPHHFLTVHGGSLFAGDSYGYPILTISGTVNDKENPVLSANGWITTANLKVVEIIYCLNEIVAVQTMTCNNKLYALTGPNYINNTQFGTSAVFRCMPNLLQGISAIDGSHSHFGLVSATGDVAIGSDVYVAGSIYCDSNGSFVDLSVNTFGADSMEVGGNVLVYGSTTTDSLIVDSSSLFNGVASFSSDLISSSVVYANQGIYEFSRPFKTGFWTKFDPAVTVNPGTGSITYITRLGDYTIIGETMILRCEIDVTFTDGAPTSFTINMPTGWKSKNSIDLANACRSVVYGADLSSPTPAAGYIERLTVDVPRNSTLIYVAKVDPATQYVSARGGGVAVHFSITLPVEPV